MVRTGPAEHGKRRLFVEGGQSKEKQKRRVETLTKKEVERANKRVKSPVRVEERVGRKRSRSPSRMRDSVQNNFSKGLKQVLKSVEKKRAKARMRQAKYQKKLRTTVGERNLLELCSIKEPQRRNYAKKVDEFYGFVSHHGLPLSTEEHLDEALCEYADELYLNGESVNAGEQLKAALEFDLPTAARGGSLVLPRFKRALKGWRRMAPNQTRLPMLEFLKSSISGVMIAAGHLEEALFNEVTFSTYTRPGELLRVLPCDVVKKNQDYHFDVIILSPHERGVSSKVGIYDDTVILDDTRAPWLGSLLVELAEKKEKISQENSIWSFSAAKYLETWRKAVQVLQIEDVAITPYQNRHGGASRDHLCRLRSMMAIQRRGRWASDASTRIYSKP